jgi:hypothetical protein
MLAELICVFEYFARSMGVACHAWRPEQMVAALRFGRVRSVVLPPPMVRGLCKSAWCIADYVGLVVLPPPE